ncbi:hypothetical protein PIROE2DRAFT_16549 [Piromyces sp. E2]|nr:hypothetical protein PIROE2DRAFT_16549 [Piromyces sp. E2]|eukprot:OUM58238.1 hypothetical protein PIROE2DRAFT_16549 [Piromyces sp. E2]
MNSSIVFKFLAIFAIVAGALAAPLIKKEEIITYKKDADVNYYKNLSLDIYYNERNYKSFEKLPVIIFIHGGFWINGDKSTYNKAGELFQKEGYVAVIPNYTVFINDQTVTIDDMVDEIHHVIEWTFANISKYGGDPQKITLSGHSSGAHLAALTLVKSDFGIENKGVILNKLPMLQHALFLNGPYTLDLDSAVQQLNAAGLGQLALGLTALFTNAKNAFPYNVLATITDKIDTLSAKQVTIFDTENDLLIPSVVALGFMGQIQRTTERTSVNYVLLPDSENAVKPDAYGGHNRITVDLYDSHTVTDVEAKTFLLEVVKKYNPSKL